MEAPDATTFSAGSGGPKSMLPGWLWRIPSDDNRQFLTHRNPDDSPTGHLGAIADAHNGSGSVSSEFSPALSVDHLSSRAKSNKPVLYAARRSERFFPREDLVCWHGHPLSAARRQQLWPRLAQRGIEVSRWRHHYHSRDGKVLCSRLSGAVHLYRYRRDWQISACCRRRNHRGWPGQEYPSHCRRILERHHSPILTSSKRLARRERVGEQGSPAADTTQEQLAHRSCKGP